MTDLDTRLCAIDGKWHHTVTAGHDCNPTFSQTGCNWQLFKENKIKRERIDKRRVFFTKLSRRKQHVVKVPQVGFGPQWDLVPATVSTTHQHAIHVLMIAPFAPTVTSGTSERSGWHKHTPTGRRAGRHTLPVLSKLVELHKHTDTHAHTHLFPVVPVSCEVTLTWTLVKLRYC